jgi:hypothetical protein
VGRLRVSPRAVSKRARSCPNLKVPQLAPCRFLCIADKADRDGSAALDPALCHILDSLSSFRQHAGHLVSA